MNKEYVIAIIASNLVGKEYITMVDGFTVPSKCETFEDAVKAARKLLSLSMPNPIIPS